eukprot:Amastigsp_a343381_13.p3 type:complete len:139 gc:universal Amastigsp_a343381_13:150-566(+)
MKWPIPLPLTQLRRSSQLSGLSRPPKRGSRVLSLPFFHVLAMGLIEVSRVALTRLPMARGYRAHLAPTRSLPSRSLMVKTPTKTTMPMPCSPSTRGGSASTTTKKASQGLSFVASPKGKTTSPIRSSWKHSRRRRVEW